MSWKQKIDHAIAGRPDLAFDDLVAEFRLPAGSDQNAVRRALGMFAQEYELPIGKLRGDDPLTLFTTPVRTMNPLSWFFDRAAVEDKTSELSYALKNERKRLGLAPIPREAPVTIRDFVMAWLGPMDHTK